MLHEILLLAGLISSHGLSREAFGNNDFCNDYFCQNFGAKNEAGNVEAGKPSADDRQSLRSEFSVPDGAWWMHQRFDIKYGFLIGEEDCYLSRILKNMYVDDPGIRSNIIRNYYNRIDKEIQNDKILLIHPITDSIRRVLKYHNIANGRDIWEKKFGYAPGMGDGDIWALYGDDDIRYGYVYGYLSCKYQYLSKAPKHSISYIEHSVSLHYGLINIYATDDNDVMVKNGTARDKIDDLIDRF